MLRRDHIRMDAIGRVIATVATTDTKRSQRGHKGRAPLTDRQPLRSVDGERSLGAAEPFVTVIEIE